MRIACSRIIILCRVFLNRLFFLSILSVEFKVLKLSSVNPKIFHVPLSYTQSHVMIGQFYTFLIATNCTALCIIP